VQLHLLEPRDSAYAARIEGAASEAGLQVVHLDSIAAAPPNARLVAIGPSIGEPLQVARQLRTSGAQALLVFFAASESSRDAVNAELLRDPFVYPHTQVVELPGNARQLASRMGKVVDEVKRELHTAPGRGRARTRPRSGSASLGRLAGRGEHYLAHILAHTRDAIISTDESGRIIMWSDGARRLFGFTPDAALGRGLDLVDRAQHLEALAKRVLASGRAEEEELECETARGQRVEVAATVAPIADSQGKLLGVSIIARDDADYQRVQEALREANRQKDEFLAIMSHELRTPLTSILGYTDMLLRGLSGPLAPLANKYIGNVRGAGDRLLDLVNGLLDYTRLEAGAERLELRPVDLARIVSQAVEHCRSNASNKNIDLHLAIANGPATGLEVEADEERVGHVIRSMLGNALKFTPGGGWVRVNVGPDPEADEAVRVTVSDSGIGLNEEQIGRVWERFYQGDASLTRPYGGMGLGLSIARHLVALHGGSVGAESRGPGRGSTFWFTLPLRVGQAAS
jgi:PAS domain S-box-containing protein